MTTAVPLKQNVLGAASATRPSGPDDQAPEALAIPADHAEAIATTLTRYLGPIAPLVVKRESRGSSSLEELRQRLAALIPAEVDRTEFLRLIEGRTGAAPDVQVPSAAHNQSD